MPLRAFLLGTPARALQGDLDFGTAEGADSAPTRLKGLHVELVAVRTVEANAHRSISPPLVAPACLPGSGPTQPSKGYWRPLGNPSRSRGPPSVAVDCLITRGNAGRKPYGPAAHTAPARPRRHTDSVQGGPNPLFHYNLQISEGKLRDSPRRQVPRGPRAQSGRPASGRRKAQSERDSKRVPGRVRGRARPIRRVSVAMRPAGLLSAGLRLAAGW